MQISDDVLRRATEAQLLTLLITWHEFSHPAEKPLDAIAQAIQINKSTLVQAHAGKGYIGIRHWLEIERRFGFTLWRRWVDLQ